MAGLDCRARDMCTMGRSPPEVSMVYLFAHYPHLHDGSQNRSLGWRGYSVYYHERHKRRDRLGIPSAYFFEQ